MKNTLLILAATLAIHATALAQAPSKVPSIISYQGNVTTAAGVPIGAAAPENRVLTFRFWNHPTDTAAENRLYSESQTVTLLNGDFSVLIGNGTPVTNEENLLTMAGVFSSNEVFLGITVDDGDSATADPEMSPRQQIATTAFAFRATVAEGVDAGAITTDMLASNAVTTNQLADSAITSAKLAPNAVTTDQLADGAITTNQLADSAITTAKLASNAVTTDQLADGAITTNQLADGAITTNKIVDGTIQLEDLIAAVKNSLCPVGTVLTYTGDTAPEGWLMCHGAAISRADYSALYAVIGNRFGYGNGDTTFHIPDFRGKFLRGHDAGAGYDPDRNSRGSLRTGGATGDSVGSFQSDALRSHTHTESTMVNNGFATDSLGNLAYANVVGPAESGATGGSETRPVNISVNYIIKY
jgi:microcystin-dependent protein